MHLNEGCGRWDSSVGESRVGQRQPRSAYVLLGSRRTQPVRPLSGRIDARLLTRL
jgi:hypothetical protein